MNKQDLERFWQMIASGEIQIVMEDDNFLGVVYRDAPNLIILFAKHGEHLDKIGEATRDGMLLWCKSHKEKQLLTWQDYHQGLERDVPRLNILCLDGAPHLRLAAPGERLEGKAHFIQAIVRHEKPIGQSD